MPVTVKDEWQPLDSFRPHPKNYNSHPERQVQALADAMRITAFTAPIICKPDGTILGGHARRLALLQLREQSYPEPEGIKPGWMIPCRVVTCNRTDELRILATDNAAEWDVQYDPERLSEILGDLSSEDALSGTWYTNGDLETLLFGLEVNQQDPGKDSPAAEQKPLREEDLVVTLKLLLPTVRQLEQAISATGEKSRGVAVQRICQAYLDAR